VGCGRCGVWAVWGVGGVGGVGVGVCGRCGGVGSLLTFDIPQTALVASLDTYDFLFFSDTFFKVCKELIFWRSTQVL
jgi:hypothetical protein